MHFCCLGIQKSRVNPNMTGFFIFLFESTRIFLHVPEAGKVRNFWFFYETERKVSISFHNNFFTISFWFVVSRLIVGESWPVQTLSILESILRSYSGGLGRIIGSGPIARSPVYSYFEEEIERKTKSYISYMSHLHIKIVQPTKTDHTLNQSKSYSWSDKPPQQR